MKKALFIFYALFAMNTTIFPQNLSGARVEMYYYFYNFCWRFQEWYYKLWISREWEVMNTAEKAKYNNRIKEFGDEMMENAIFAALQSTSDFDNHKTKNDDFKNDIKLLLEQLDNSEGTINDWNILLIEESGYFPKDSGYNNIEIMAYTIDFLINSCVLLDREFPDNTITDSIIEKIWKNLNRIRENNSGYFMTYEIHTL